MKVRRFSGRVGAVVGMAALVGVGGCLPVAGPYSQDIIQRAQQNETASDFLVLTLTPQLVDKLAWRGDTGLSGVFTDRRPPPSLPIGVGDVVQVTIFESAAGGLFIPEQAGARPGNFITLPSQSVGQSGDISVPFVGSVRAAGRTPGQVGAEIEARLRNRAIEPQAVVAVTDARRSLASVLGEVNTPTRFALNPAGERMLEALARAGGPRGQGFDMRVTLQRNGRVASVNYNTLLRSPENNIFVHPGDIISVSRENRSFLALGASGSNGQVRFDQEGFTIAEAVARAGGLLDERADPSAVFLYRIESRSLLERAGVNVSNFHTARVPVIYQLNLREPGGLFLAQKAPVLDRDIVFFGNATTVDYAKFLQFVRLNMATVNEGIITRNNINNLR